MKLAEKVRDKIPRPAPDGRDGHAWISRDRKIYVGIGGAFFAFHLRIGHLTVLWGKE
jgi:hypothetical protein